MGRSILMFLVLFVLFFSVSITQAGEIQVRVDEKGRKVFYNIPSKDKPVSIYYSRRAEDYLNIIREICDRHHVDADLVKAVIQVESNYNPRAVSPKGASGLMQLMPETALRYGVRSIFDPVENIDGGVRYLKDLLALFNRDLRLTVAAYNAGENAVQRFKGIPKYKETQNYVKKVLALYNGDSSYAPDDGKPRIVSYYKYQDEKGITHYTIEPVPGYQATKVTFYY